MNPSPFLQEEDVQLYYEVTGSGAPIVFLHPPVMGHVTFRFQRPLEQHYQLIFLDLINSGRSTKISGKISIVDFAQLVYRLVEHLQLEKVIVCGYSNGGSIAQEFALRYPDRTAAVILIGGFPEVSTYILKKEFDLGVWAAKKGLLPLFAFILPFAHFNTKKARQEMAAFISRADSQTLETIYENGMSYISTDRLHKLKVPLLLLYGKNDFYMRSYLLPFCENVKDIDIVFVSDVAHQVPTKRPDECNTIIDRWIKRKGLA